MIIHKIQCKTNNLVRRGACFICSSPYQVIGAMSIAMHIEKDADIYIIRRFSSSSEVCSNLRGTNVFKGVYDLPDLFDSRILSISSRWKRRLYKVFLFLSSKKIAKEALEANVDYERIYTSCQNAYMTLIKMGIAKSGKRPELIKFEDGIGSYSLNSHLLSPREWEAWIRRFIAGRGIDESNAKIYLYCPQAAEYYDDANMRKRIKQQPRLSLTPKTIDLLNEIFSYSEDCKIEEKAIIFDTARTEQRAHTFEVLDNVYEEIANRLGFLEVVIKTHPKSSVTDHTKIKHYRNYTIPIETVYANMYDLNNRILISWRSTAVITPKLLFDQEPMVILLYKLMNISIDTNLERVFYKIKSLYQDSSRFMIPNDRMELQQALNIIASEPS